MTPRDLYILTTAAFAAGVITGLLLAPSTPVPLQTAPVTATPTPRVSQVARAGRALAMRPSPHATHETPTDEQLYLLRVCESSNNYADNTGNGYYGAYQFDLSTWQSNGGVGRPDLAPPAVQDAMTRLLYSRRGAQPWPTCGHYLHYR